MSTPSFTEPPEAPSRLKPNFSALMDAFLAYISTMRAELAAAVPWMADQVSAVSAASEQVTASAAIAASSEQIAKGAANYQGDYDAGTLYAIGESVTYAGSQFVKKTSAPAGTVPVDGGDWLELKSSGEGAVGDLLFSLVVPPAPWLLSDGSVSLKTSQPELSEVVGYTWEYDGDLADRITADVNPANVAYALSFTSDGNHFAVGHYLGPNVSIFAWNSGSPTKVADPAALPTGSGRDVAFSPNDNILAVAHDTSPFVTFYNTSTPGSPVKLANPAALPPQNGYGVSWTPDGRYCAHVAYSTTNCLTIYDFDTGLPVKLAGVPAVQPAYTGWHVAYSPDGAFLAVGHGQAPFITIFDNSVPSNPQKLADPIDLPGAIIKKVVWSPDGRYLFCLANGAGDNSRVYDMDTGVPVSVSFAEGVAIQTGGVEWKDNTTLVTLATNMAVLEIKNGEVVQSTSVDYAAHSLCYNMTGMYFRSIGGESHVVATGQSAPFLAAQVREFDPQTHFRIPDIGIDSGTFYPNGGANRPKLYLKGG